MSNNIKLDKPSSFEIIINKESGKKYIIVPWDNIGETVKTLRKERGISRKKLSQDSKIPEATLKRLEHGKGVQAYSMCAALRDLGVVLAVPNNNGQKISSEEQIQMIAESLCELNARIQNIEMILKRIK